MPLDDREILGMTGLDQARRGRSGDQEGGVVAMINLALVALHQAVADPEHAGRDLARHTVGRRHGEYIDLIEHSSALLVAADIARHGDTLVTGLKKLVQHLVVPLHHVAPTQDAAVAGGYRLDVMFVEDV